MIEKLKTNYMRTFIYVFYYISESYKYQLVIVLNCSNYNLEQF